jgi:hypothetical protein
MTASMIKTPLTMSRAEFDRMLIERISDMAARLSDVADRLDRVVGPPPRPDLKVVPAVTKEGDDA